MSVYETEGVKLEALYVLYELYNKHVCMDDHKDYPLDAYKDNLTDSCENKEVSHKDHRRVSDRDDHMGNYENEKRVAYFVSKKILVKLVISMFLLGNLLHKIYEPSL